jgi:hypothetical protein
VTTGVEAVGWIARTTGLLAVAVDRAAKLLKQHPPGLWPKSGQGGGKASQHVEADHLTNILLAIAAADPITTAPAVVRARRGHPLMPHPVSEREYIEITQALPGIFRKSSTLAPEGSVYLESDIVAPTFGESLDKLTRFLATHEGKMAGIHMAVAEFHVEMELSPNGGGAYVFDAGGLRRSICFGRQLSELEMASAPYSPIHRIASVPLTLLETLGALWGDTAARKSLADRISSPAPASTTAGEGIECAGSPPREPAPIRDQDRNNDPGDATAPEIRGEGGLSQAPRRGPDPSKKGDGLRGRHRTHSTPTASS